MTYREILSKSVGFPLQDLLKGTNIVKNLTFLRETSAWDLERLQELQLKKLQALISFASRNVPYYEELFKKIRLKPQDINSLSDIIKIPILTKEIVRKENHRLVARDLSGFRIKVGKTGGTTGMPVVVYKDAQNRSMTWASYYRWFEWLGLHYSNSVATFWGDRTVIQKNIRKEFVDSSVNYLQNRMKISAFNLYEERYSLIYKQLLDFRPKLLKGYLSALVDFARFLKFNNLPLPSLVALSSTSETLLDINRKYLEQIFNVPIFDQYGCGEVSAISYECAKHSGMHITMEHIILEILGSDCNPVCEELGAVVATDLDNFVMPFIRYENGDLAIKSTDVCSCGLAHEMIKKIEGRAIDTITLNNGAKVHGVFFTDIFHELGIHANKISRFQVAQSYPGEINMKLETNETLGKSQRITLEEVLKMYFNDFQIEEVQRIPEEQNGKFKYIIGMPTI